MSGIMPPEPPPPGGENDYGPAARRASAAGAQVGAAEPFSVSDIPVPPHLSTVDATPNLNKAWAQALAEDHASIPKRGRNKFFNYDYATADDIRRYIASILGKNGLHYEQHLAGYTPWGALIRVTYFFFVCHESGERSPAMRHDELARTTSEKGGPDDKALGKAGVLALKNWSKIHFSIDTGDLADDPDGDPPVTDPANPPPATTSKRAVSQPSAKNAFRDAGLAPKTEPLHDTQTGEIKEDWTSAANRVLDHGRHKTVADWMDDAHRLYETCPTAEAIGAMDKFNTMQKAMASGQPAVKSDLASWRAAALDRLATPAAEPSGAQRA